MTLRNITGFSGSVVGNLLSLWGPCSVTGQGRSAASQSSEPPSQSVKPADLERPLCDKEKAPAADRSPVVATDPVQPETKQ